jgi:hypothetical protein
MSHIGWHSGMNLVCVKRGGWAWQFGPYIPGTHPEYGEIVTVAHFDRLGDDVFISLAEYNPSAFYFVGNFRRVQRRATDISIFTQMLNPSKVDA